jgi:hypothetical protein
MPMAFGFGVPVVVRVPRVVATRQGLELRNSYLDHLEGGNPIAVPCRVRNRPLRTGRRLGGAQWETLSTRPLPAASQEHVQ